MTYFIFTQNQMLNFFSIKLNQQLMHLFILQKKNLKKLKTSILGYLKKYYSVLIV